MALLTISRGICQGDHRGKGWTTGWGPQPEAQQQARGSGAPAWIASLQSKGRVAEPDRETQPGVDARTHGCRKGDLGKWQHNDGQNERGWRPR